ncbi:MAG TPA: LysM peptidoglycan-binding domain-containing protein [Arthrobacter sp.]|nr:LysM peptidoglycan-binding domain-containing protein [Arthrobacter sp.]
MTAISTVHVSGSAEAMGRLHLTRRGRMVIFGMPAMLLVAVLLSMGGFLNSPAKASDSVTELQPTNTVSVTVQAGQSLWGIAGVVAPNRDPREVVAEIIQLNNLLDGRITPGQRLFVPSA